MNPENPYVEQGKEILQQLTHLSAPTPVSIQ